MSEYKVPYVNLTLQHQAIKVELIDAIEEVLDHGQFILGPEVNTFEDRFAEYCGTSYAIGVDNCTSALHLALRALGIGSGDEVITVPNSFIASASCIALAGATPIFVDVREDYNIDPTLIEAAITPHTKAIIPVHLTGRPADMTPILDIANHHNLYVVEDCAQAVGARYYDQSVGSFGTIGCFSLHPLKTLNAAGDGGVITTNNPELYEILCKARNHGLRNRDESEFWSYNCRLDTLQAAMLLVKMKYLDKWTAARRAIAAKYHEYLQDVVQLPYDKPFEYSVFHTFVIQADRRNDLQKCLSENGIDTKVHYPIPIHLQQAAKELGNDRGRFPVTERQARHILSLPVYPELTAQQISFVIATVRDFYE